MYTMCTCSSLLLHASITCVLLKLCTSSRILLMPFAFKSHVFEISAIGNELRNSGHDIFILLPQSYPELDQVRAKSGFKVIDYSVKERDFYSMSASDNDWIDVALNSDPLQELRTNVDGFIQLCTNPLEDAALPGRLRDLHLDLAVVDAFPGSRCYWVLARWIDIPYVSLTTQYEPWLWRVPAVPSFVPFPLAAGGTYTERMTFWERLWNALILLDWTVCPRVEYVDNLFVDKYLPGETYWTLASTSLLWLLDTDVVIDYPRPTMPNEINVGGLSASAAGSLTGDLKEFADAAHNGLVIVAFGSMDVYSERFFDEFFTAFSALSEYRIAWRYSGELPTSYNNERLWPKHILVREWLPLNDLLGHFNTRLLVFHCGANSQFEALYHGVPEICLTVWADQMYNAARMHYRGYGIDLGRLRDVSVDKLVTGARQILTNRSYADTVRAASLIFRSRPQNPRQRAAWWIDHVMQYGGSHLHSYALDMPWYEYLMLDIFVVCLLLPVVVMTSAVTACFCCCIRRHTDRPSTHHKQH